MPMRTAGRYDERGDEGGILSGIMLVRNDVSAW